MQQTVLIIDDEPSILESLSSHLSDEGYRTLTAETGEEGLELFLKERVDIVLTDLRMPGMDGLDLMKRVLSCDPDTPMVVISGAGKREDIIKALQMGAKDYITKPITDLDMISHTITRALENKRLLEQNKRYRRRLEKSEARYRTITEQIAEGVFTVDVHENITFCNPAFCRMSEFSQSALQSMNLTDLVTQESAAEIRRQTLLRQQGITGRYEVQLISKTGKTVHLELSCNPLYDNRNVYAGAIAVTRDISKIIVLRHKFKKFLRQEESRSNHVVAICANCKRVRDKDNTWRQVEDFFNHVSFSHGICPTCCRHLYPDIDLDEPES